MGPLPSSSVPDGNPISQLASASSAPVIAVDLDDVLSQTNLVVAQWHNETYGTDMDLSSFYYYHWWKNPHWGTPAETIAKVKDLYATARPHHAPPIPGALDGVARLRALGFRLVIVTAREQRDMPETMRWLGEHFPDVFESVVCTGLGKDAVDWTGNEIPTKLTKPEVCRSLKALALIDDALENALACATSDPPTPVLLFGANEWNKRVSRVSSVAPSGSGAEAHERSTVREGDAAGIDITQMSFAERLRYENGREFWHDDARAAESRVPEGAPVTRVRDWDEVVRWFVKHHPAA